jgi:hypothetical protein
LLRATERNPARPLFVFPVDAVDVNAAKANRSRPLRWEGGGSKFDAGCDGLTQGCVSWVRPPPHRTTDVGVHQGHGASASCPFYLPKFEPADLARFRRLGWTCRTGKSMNGARYAVELDVNSGSTASRPAPPNPSPLESTGLPSLPFPTSDRRSSPNSRSFMRWVEGRRLFCRSQVT